VTAGKPSPAPNYHLPQINQPAQRSTDEAGAKSGPLGLRVPCVEATSPRRDRITSMCGGDIPTPGSYYYVSAASVSCASLCNAKRKPDR